MRLPIGVALVSALFILPSVAPAGALGSSAAISSAYARNQALRSYTFHLDVVMAMRHFPWLHFNMRGTGQYDRGDRYIVHFTSSPWFAPKVQDVDLSMIAPSMWPSRYSYEPIGEVNGDTLFALHALQGDTLKSATVALNPSSGIHWIDATYANGTHIHMMVSSNDVDGFLLPETLDASVDYPHMSLSADSDFTDYTLTSD